MDKAETLDADWRIAGAQRDRQSITREWRPSDIRLIDGVAVHEVRPVMTGYGHLTEMLRSEWLGGAEKIGQIFTSTLMPGRISAWHAHGETTDRLFVATGLMRVALYDARAGSPTFGLVNEIRLGAIRPALVIVPPRVWHGIQNIGAEPSVLINAVDVAYEYESPDHWRVAHDCPDIPYQFPR
jgi:dTDP-4-dehydrorhamnose 3,5-epimerase